MTALASMDAWSLMQNMKVPTLISDPSPSFIEAFIYGFFFFPCEQSNLSLCSGRR